MHWDQGRSVSRAAGKLRCADTALFTPLLFQVTLLLALSPCHLLDKSSGFISHPIGCRGSCLRCGWALVLTAGQMHVASCYACAAWFLDNIIMREIVKRCSKPSGFWAKKASVIDEPTVNQAVPPPAGFKPWGEQRQQEGGETQGSGVTEVVKTELNIIASRARDPHAPRAPELAFCWRSAAAGAGTGRVQWHTLAAQFASEISETKPPASQLFRHEFLGCFPGSKMCLVNLQTHSGLKVLQSKKTMYTARKIKPEKIANKTNSVLEMLHREWKTWSWTLRTTPQASGTKCTHRPPSKGKAPHSLEQLAITTLCSFPLVSAMPEPPTR